jgi:hypothetical protein
MVEETGVVVRRRSRAETARIAGLFPSSGMGRQEFCESHGLSLSTLSRHLKKQAQGETGSGEGGESRLVAVELIRPGTGVLTVMLRNGRRVEVGRGFDAGTLAQLVDVLERV